MSRKIGILGVLALVGLTGCGAPNAQGINDPFEETNRKWHETNLAIDRGLVGPAAKTYGLVPPELRASVSNVADTLSLPGVMVNDVLQLRFGDALSNGARLVLNATLGIGGLFDPATGMGLAKRDSDFGETLNVWGAGEGRYVVLPLLGPSTERDALGIMVDIALDPLGHVLDPSQMRARTGFKVLELADDRTRYSDLYESVLYGSADSYTAMRLTYLDKRRYDLGKGDQVAGESAGVAYDIYEDFYE